MKVTERFTRQHSELATLAKQLTALLDPVAISADSTAVRKRLSEFIGKLKVHAAMEDEALYPRLLEHADASVRDSAKRLYDDVKNIYTEFAEFSARWSQASAIAASAPRFVEDVHKLLARLAKRMQVEGRELHPLAERVLGGGAD